MVSFNTIQPIDDSSEQMQSNLYILPNLENITNMPRKETVVAADITKASCSNAENLVSINPVEMIDSTILQDISNQSVDKTEKLEEGIRKYLLVSETPHRKGKKNTEKFSFAIRSQEYQDIHIKKMNAKRRGKQKKNGKENVTKNK